MELKRTPSVGETVHLFDDGKIRNERYMKGKVLRVLPFEEFKKEFYDYGRTEDMEWMSHYEMWEEEVSIGRPYADKTDFIIEVECPVYDAPMYFTRAADGGWFSFDTSWHMMAAMMDIDHEYTEEYDVPGHRIKK